MNYYQLKDEIEILVDPEREDMIERIPDLINEAVHNITNEPGVIVPDLKVITSVDTVLDQAYTTLPTTPDTFNGKLLFGSVDGNKVDASNTLEDLMEEYPDLTDTGDVEALALEGATLWYTRIPTEVTSVMLLLYKNPAELVSPSDIPTSIPAHLHRQTIIPYVAEHLFDMIEQDIDGKKPNMLVQKALYEQGVVKFREFLAARRRGMSRSIWNV